MEKVKELTDVEKIRRVEQAPQEIQAMVAKAFIRKDIDDDCIQYTFNTDTIEELNDVEEGFVIENADTEEVEGIGAGDFFVRNCKPGAGNKNFITTCAGGWNTSIKGYPRDKDCDVLANCVGYANGRFNEIINHARGSEGSTYKTLNCNAENFIERAKAAGLEIGTKPRAGAIGCAMKGTSLSGCDGAGHVWIVERVDDDNNIYTSESGYGSIAYWNQRRNNNNGRWGLGKGYTFRGFIYLPTDVQTIVDGGEKPDPKPEPTPCNGFNVGDEVIINGNLYISSNAMKPNGSVKNKRTKITRKVCGTAHPYNTTGDLGWMEEKDIKKYIEPQPDKLKVGDTVKIVGTGNGSSYGNAGTAYGIGWTRKILAIWNGRPYPYQVGDNKGTTGFYKESALKKK